MIVADTSVWVEFLHGRPAVVARLSELLDADHVALPINVRIEVLAGLPERTLGPFSRALQGLEPLYPSHDTWALMEQWVLRASRRGERFAVSDLLVAALATERGATVWSRDVDFARLAKLGFVRLDR